MKHLLFSLSLLFIFEASMLQAQNLFTLGDSNGEARDGWVVQLRSQLPEAHVFNQSFSGNTIGFDNLGQPRLNTLKNIDRYIEAAVAASPGKAYDYMIICLGTNDCKAEYHDRRKEVAKNYATLLKSIRNHPGWQGHVPQLVVVTPPPYGDDSIMEPKYAGGDARVKALSRKMKGIARKEKALYVDIYSKLKPQYAELSPDGIHMKAEGQKLIAGWIAEQIKP